MEAHIRVHENSNKTTARSDRQQAWNIRLSNKIPAGTGKKHLPPLRFNLNSKNLFCSSPAYVLSDSSSAESCWDSPH